MKLVVLIMEVFIIAHFLACGWYYVSMNGVDETSCVDPCVDTDPSLVDQAAAGFARELNVDPVGDDPCQRTFECEWVMMADLKEDRSDGRLSHYLTSLYWVVTTITTVGYGDIYAGTNVEKVYATMSMLIGVTVFGYVIGSMSRIVSTIAQPGQRRREKLDAVKHYVREQKLPRDVQKDVNIYFEAYCKTNSVFDEDVLLAPLRPNLRKEILLYTNRHVTDCIYIFRKLVQIEQETFLDLAALKIYSPGDYLFFAGDPAEAVFFLYRGALEIVVDPGLEEVRMFPECSLNVHSMIPECSLNVHSFIPECSLNVPCSGYSKECLKTTPYSDCEIISEGMHLR
jgi:hypothetical protein